MQPIIAIENLNKTYSTGHKALREITLHIAAGEVFALLGPNGAGKTTLISIICGLVNASTGKVLIDGLDNVRDYRQARKYIGLVPQEMTLGIFNKVWDTVCYSRGLFGKKADPQYIEQLLKDLSLYDKKDEQIITLSGGMKRRVLIAKALAHDPRILFLDEPTAGVDVALRKSMWQLIRRLHKRGVTIILTTHYIEEAEAIAQRVGIINKGSLILVEQKKVLMKQLGKRQFVIELREKIDAIPSSLQKFGMTLANKGTQIVYTYSTVSDSNAVSDILKTVTRAKLPIKDLTTFQSSLEDIFVDLVKN